MTDLNYKHPLPAPPVAQDALKVSFEFFPPKTEAMAETLWQSVERLEPLAPRFVSVTYGAGGTTRERTHNTVARINAETSLTAAAHLTCVGATRDEVNRVAEQYWEAGIRHIVALRGDAPDNSDGYTPHPGGYDYAVDLVKGLRDVADFEISVAAYPEVHPTAASAFDDLDNLKRKLDVGATRAITQYFFDVGVYLEFLERVRKAGIDVEIVPGILPVTNFAQVVKFSKMCGTNVPDWMARLFEGLDGDPDTRRLVAATAAAEQCRLLQSEGIDAFHFYTLNRADLSFAICHILGVRPNTENSQETDI
jgi:methylenetetrahydrofolate reductase (NADPH)